METKGIQINLKSIALFILHFLILADILFITIGLLLDLPTDLSYFVLSFDLFICIILFSEWIINFLRAESKKEFLKDKDHWLTLIASIPIEILLPDLIPSTNILRYVMLFKLFRIIVLYKKFFSGFKKFVKKTNLDKIIGAIFVTVTLFTLLYLYFGSTGNLFESFYFVMVTLTTVGYGDIVPQTFNEKIITLLLIIVGIFIVSTITAAMSSYLTDRLLGGEEEELMDSIQAAVEENTHDIMNELKNVREENKKLQDEINELKELIKNK
ncbi:potassium channel family protein [Methanobrevibacter sp.]|uniref:potassium channel family protein n=1 Tax=Methanobrevibacter sp. TaxID=66852 RepID=UPI003869E4E6